MKTLEKHSPKTFTDLIKRMRQATVLVGICDHNPTNNQLTNITSLGSGFFINNNGLMITSKHVVPNLTGNKEVFIFQKINETTAWYSHSKQIIYDFPDLDICGIKFNKNVSSLPLEKDKILQGDEIAIYGYPASQITFINGLIDGTTVIPRSAKTNISSIEKTTIPFDTFTLVDKKILEAQFIFVQGNSGGPIVHSKTGKVVGIVSGVRHIPQAHKIVTVNGQNVYGIPFASYALGISIEELIPRLNPSDFSTWWKKQNS